MANNSVNRYIIFKLDTQQYALHLAMVERIVRAAAVTLVPNSPVEMLGMINVQGHVMPVVSLRRLYGLPVRELSLSDQFIITRTPRATLALVVDEVIGTDSCDDNEIIEAAAVMPGLDGLRVIVKNGTEIVILHDPDRLPNLETITQLEAILGQSRTAL